MTCEMCPRSADVQTIQPPGCPPMDLCVCCRAEMEKVEAQAARFGETPEEYERRKAAALEALRQPWDGT